MSARVELPATLTWELPVRVIDVSASGCLIETWRPIEVGTTGTLQLRLTGEECWDEVEVARCHQVQGVPALYHVGVRLLSRTPLHGGSIRDFAPSRPPVRDRLGAAGARSREHTRAHPRH